ncbi:MAG: hypothetical protein JNM62_00975 [Flavobacteriales bacterium]|nr:hypothetical protein [Flavobacteriales bacterium]
MDQKLSQRRERLQVRRALINELHFTHANMTRLLRAIAPRESNGRLGALLRDQLAHDQRAQRAVTDLGMDLGSPPGPCVCAESEAVLEVVHHADRVDRDVARRDLGIVDALREARVFIIRRWGALLDGVEREQGDGPMFDRILSLQANEADSHRDLVRISGILNDDLSGGPWKRSARA